MTMRDRILAVIHGRELDRVPFVQYDGMIPTAEVWDVVGRDNLGLLRWSSVHALHAPHCTMVTEQFAVGDRPAVRTILTTPAGALTQERRTEPAYGTSSAYHHFVREPEDYHILLAYLRDIQVVEDREPFMRGRAELGDDGLPMVAVPRTPYQQLWVEWVSLQDLSLHFVDYSELLAEVTGELERIELEVFEIVYRVASEAPMHFVDLADNITAPTIGERNFRRYCVPLYRRLVEMMADLDVKVFAHMDGDLKPLWGAIRDSGLQGIDSFSPPPDNDTSCTDALREWPEMRLFVNFPSSVHLAPPEGVYDKAWELLEQAGRTGQLQIQISEDPPVGAWRHSYPPIVRAIHDFAAMP